MSSQQPTLSVEDLQAPAIPQFRGITGSFFEGSATFINYAVPVNSQITKTPQNKAGVAKMQQILRKFSATSKAAVFGDSMTHNELKKSTFLDQTVNNQTIVHEYGKAIIEELIKTDVEYLRNGLYGDANYLENVQMNNTRGVPVGLLGEPAVSRASSQSSFIRRSTPRSTSRMKSQYSENGRSGKLAASDLLQPKDIMKGVDYIC